MENSFPAIVSRSNSILILLPARAYFDQVAAGLGLYLSLSELKPTTIVSTDPMTVEFNRLIGVNKITTELGNKNLVIRFNSYKADDIERVSYDIDEGQFKLTVIPKNGIVAPTKDQINLSYSGGSADLVLLVGGMNDSHFPQIMGNDLNPKEMVHVGNKQLTLSSSKSCLSFSKPSPSCSEVAYELLLGSKMKVTPDSATNFLMGVEDGTNSFNAEGVTADTFAIMSELIQLGGKRMPQSTPAGSYPPGSIPGVVQKQGDLPEAHNQSTPSTGAPVMQTNQQVQPQPQSQPQVQSQVGQQFAPDQSAVQVGQTQVQSQSQVQNPSVQQQVEQVQPGSPNPVQQQAGGQTQSAGQPSQEDANPPKEWLQQPKVYKGTSVN